MQTQFSTTLLDWHQTIERKMPWKDNKNPFHIWLSEIILQQTRVEQGTPYFLKFRDRFPDVKSLAQSSDEELMKLWQGLGYYSRARNLHKAAKLIEANGGQFPDTYKDLLALPGVGPYTAAAIASFAYDIPVPVIDGNVNRVISRFYGIAEAIDTKEGKQAIEEAVNSVFDSEQSAMFNQAIMDFGALICKPKRPNCGSCTFNSNCIAFTENMVSTIPLKIKKVKKTNRSFNYVVISYDGQFLIRKRTESDIWKHLHDFPELDFIDEILTYKSKKETIIDGPYKHILTHQNLQVNFHFIEAQELILEKGIDYFLVERENLPNFAFPKIIDWYLGKKSIY